MRYETQNFQTYRITDEGERELLANFIATITHEVRYVDGRSSETILTIEGVKPNPKEEGDDAKPIKLPPIKVGASEFASLSWVLPNWGVQAVIRPGSSIKDDLRTAIQMQSNPEIETVFKHLGWTEIDGEKAFLHAGGAITKKGNKKDVKVSLPPELSKYNLANCSSLVEGVRATLDLAKLSKADITWPLIVGTICPLFGPVDFAIHLTGRTGSFKSEVMSLFQSHYGEKMDARNLPGSWASTANALEAQAYLAANSAFVIDDFVPSGTSWQVRAYQTTADKIIRAQGNQSGRARLTDTSNLQATMYPRGIVLSTGEDTPEGHSVRARMLILELAPGDVDTATLTKAQANRCKFTGTIAALAQHIAEMPPELDGRARQVRDANLTIGHSRTPAMLGRLIAVGEYFIAWAEFSGAIKKAEAAKLNKEMTAAILVAGNKQEQYLEASDPCDLFLAAIRHVLAAGLGHLRTLNGGIPLSPEVLGWTSENSLGEIKTFKSKGPIIGWIDWNKGELFIDINTGYNIIRKVAGAEIATSKQTLFKRLKDSGKLSRVDDNRQRNTVRVAAEGHTRQVIALVLSIALDTQERPQDDE